jgi:hypothetical protein
MRMELTNAQIRELVAELRPRLSPVQLMRLESLVGELHELRERESQVRYMHGIEGAV